MYRTAITLMACLFALTACKSKDGDDSSKPVVKIVYSFYTSWSALAAAEDFGDFDGKEGKLGELEKKHGVDIVLIRQEYVESMDNYAAGNFDGVTMTNTDALATAHNRKGKVGDTTVAVFPTSWSDGADKILVDPAITSWAQLEGVPVHGAELSVTQYLFWRGCQINKCDYKKWVFKNLDPVEGAPLFASKQKGIRAFGGWSPETFVIMDRRKEVKDLFNSKALAKYEIVDMLVMGQKVLDTKHGAAAAKVMAEAMHRMSERLVDAKTRDEAIQALSKRFSNLKKEQIVRALELTKVMSPKKDGKVIMGEQVKKNMPHVTGFSLEHKLIPKKVEIGWGKKADNKDAVLRFDTSYL